MEIDLVEEAPKFVSRYGPHVSLELEPVKVTKNPEGSLVKAAMLQVGVGEG